MWMHRGMAIGVGMVLGRVILQGLSFFLGMVVLCSVGFFVSGHWILGILWLASGVGLHQLARALLFRGGVWSRQSSRR